MSRVARIFAGGSAGNEQLTAVLATLLLVLLAVEGATLLRLTSLLTVHAFVGMLLIPIIALKLASTGWRMIRYYRNGEEYVRRGPPHVALRVLVAPLIVLSTIVLFATGVALLVLNETHGLLVGLHKASFVVWVGATSLHVLAHVLKLPHQIRQRVPGVTTRLGIAVVAVLAGVVLAMATLPAAERLQHHLATQFGFGDG